MPMWAGRFSKALDPRTNDFNSSIRFDARMFREDITGSLAHAAMLAEQGIISREDLAAIRAELPRICDELADGTLAVDPNAEDIHMFVEAELTARAGDAGRRLHTGRSRNDQVATDLRLHLRSEIDTLIPLISRLVTVLCGQAAQHTETVMPGYTHLQRAQPITFGHHLMAYAFMLLRDIERLRQTRRRTNLNPLGSGALATTTYPLDRYATAQALGFDGIMENSLDGVSDRDFVIELASDLSILMMHLSRFSEEVVLWCSWEFKFVELDDAFATGSSIMPQKKNPDITELVRGKTGRVYGDLMALLTVMKGLPLAYNKDMQEDKEAIFDAADTARLCLQTVIPMLETMRPIPENMRAAAARGFLNATDCADYLTRKGIPFRAAYKITGGLVARCIALDHTLETLPLEEYRQVSDAFDEDIYAAISLDACVRGRAVPGGPAPDEVKRQIDAARRQLAALGGTEE